MNHALSLTLTLSRKERGQRSPRAEALNVSPFAHRGLRPSLAQRGRAGVREKSCDALPSPARAFHLLLGCWLLLVPAMLAMNAASPGTVVAWGQNGSGQTTVPVGLSGVTAIAGGMYHTVALKSDGTVVAWGAGTTATDVNPEYGQSVVPANLSGVVAIAAGFRHSVALKSDGTVVVWGGGGGFGQTNIPTGLSGVVAIAAGDFHIVAAKDDGTVVMWGSDGHGNLPVPSGLNGVTAIASADYHTVALKNDGTVVAWGFNSHGQTTIPVGLNGVTAVATGFYHAVALKSDGTVVAWGDNSSGQTTVPASLSGVTAIAAGVSYTVALKNDGTVVAWGSNTSGQTTVPAGLNGVTAIAAGYNHTLAKVGVVPTSIFTQPMGQNFALGSGVTLRVGASGTGLSYQWQLNGNNIAGAMNPFLTLSNLAATNAGAYRVVVSSSTSGSATSQSANLLFFGDVRNYAGTILAGPVGQQFRVDYADVVNVGTTNWLVLTNITLPSSPYLVIDPSSAGQTKRFYRAVTLP